MSTLDSIRKLLNEKPDSYQLWTVMTYMLSKKGSKNGPIGYFIFLRSFPNENLAKEYVEEVVQRTGIESLIAVPSCRMLPISLESMGKVVPITVNKEGTLLSICEEQNKRNEEKKLLEEKINDLKNKDDEDLLNSDSISSIARYWYLYTKYKRLKQKHEEDLGKAEKIIEENDRKIRQRLNKIPEVITYLENRLSISKEDDLLELIKQQISTFETNIKSENF